MPPRLTKTTHRYPFHELSPGQFESMIRQLQGNLPGVEWAVRPEPIGELGSDEGQDIRAWERVRVRGREVRRGWLSQAKRWPKIGKAELEKIVEQAIPAGSKPPYKFLVGVAGSARKQAIDAFHAAVHNKGVKESEIWLAGSLEDRLNEPHNARIAAYFFGSGSAIEGTVPLPMELDRSLGRDAPLLAREAEVEALRAAPGDVILVGPAGCGKSRLAVSAEGVRYLSPTAGPDAVAESLRLRQPNHVVLDDAGLALPRLDMLLALRREGYAFKIIATAWPEHLDALLHSLPDATVIGVPLIERAKMDEILRSLGITNYYLLNHILEQAAGRPGWAIHLAEAARRERYEDVITGRGLVIHVGQDLERRTSSATRVTALLGVLAAIGRIDRSELKRLDEFLHTDLLERDALLTEAAAVGLIQQHGGVITVAPSALRAPLVAYVFYEKQMPMDIDEVVVGWPDRWNEIIGVVMEAAEASSKARAGLDVLLPDLSRLTRPEWGWYEALGRYAAIDQQAAERALAATRHLKPGDPARLVVVKTATRRFALPEAVAGMLETAVGDDRPEGPNPDHPIRILGELGRQVSPHGQTSFEARLPVLTAANAWFDADPAPGRQKAWGKVAVHLMDPNVAGNLPSTGSPMTIQMLSGQESIEHLERVVSELWPQIRLRLVRLEPDALAAVMEMADHWFRLQRRFPGPGGHQPSEEAALLAERFLNDELLPVLHQLVEHAPAAQLTLHATEKLLGARAAVRLDPEFRLLTLGWHFMHQHRRSSHVGHAVARMVDRWVAEGPAVVFPRVAGWSNETRRAGKDMNPVVQYAFRELGERVSDPDAWVVAALDAGLTYEIELLMKASLDRRPKTPAWFARAVGGPTRPYALAAALRPGPNEVAGLAAVGQLTAGDAWQAEQSVIGFSHVGHGSVSRALLLHADEEVRGVASLWFEMDPPADGRHGLPAGWYEDWARAFEVAPLKAHGDHDNYLLGKRLMWLAEHDPDLAERWFKRQLAKGADLWVLTHYNNVELSKLPRKARERLLRDVKRERRSALLENLVGEDIEWASHLLDTKIISMPDLWAALRNGIRDGLTARSTLAWAPVFLRHGAPPEEIWHLADGGSMGDRSAHYARPKAAFEAEPAHPDPQVEAARQAAIRHLAEHEAAELESERRERITGEI
jgi:hypothetical protein